ncbi:MAG: hypothetical protein NTW19_15615 [Planctomycetota bacterium]|nr:hypothetical protein [Planctomycetota bacterium]
MLSRMTSGLSGIAAVVGVALVLAGAPAWGQATQSLAPTTGPDAAAPAASAPADLDELDAPTLRLLVRQLNLRIMLLEARLKDAEPRPVAGAGSGGDIDKRPDGGWVVRVTANHAPDVAGLNNELAKIHKRIEEIAAQSRETENRVRTMQGETVSSRESTRVRGLNGARISEDRETTLPKYSDAELQAAAAPLEAMRADRRKLEMQAQGIEDDVRLAQSTRIVDGALEDGRSVVIKARGVNVSIASAMKQGKSYRVDGTASHRGEVLQITPSAIVAIDSSQPPAPMKVSP